jgi:hypothetical protein
MAPIFTKRPSIEEVAAAAATSVSSVFRDVRKGLLRKLRDQSGRVSFDADQAGEYAEKRLAMKAAASALRREA